MIIRYYRSSSHCSFLDRVSKSKGIANRYTRASRGLHMYSYLIFITGDLIYFKLSGIGIPLESKPARHWSNHGKSWCEKSDTNENSGLPHAESVTWNRHRYIPTTPRDTLIKANLKVPANQFTRSRDSIGPWSIT